MMAYRLEFTRLAEKNLAGIPREVARRVKEKTLLLARVPRPPGCTKLKGRADFYRLRVGDYRVVYQINDQHQLIEITVIAHRREVYRDL